MQIRLMIHGLAGYLPQPFTNPNVVRILFPDVRRDDIVRQNIQVCRHFPQVIVPGADPWDLVGEHIEIIGGAGGVSIEQSFLDKMSDMAKIAPGSEKVHPDYLRPHPQSPGQGHVPLVAELTLSSGTLSVEALTPELFFRDEAQGFEGPQGQFALFVQVTISVPGSATIRTKVFGSGSGEDGVTHSQVLSGAADEVVEVTIKNRCDQPDDPNRPDNDFIIYYDLSEDYNGPWPIPYPGPRPPQPSPGAEVDEVDATAFGSGGCIAGLFHR